MSWGHATSTDLINWQTGRVALHPDEFGAIWSGSAVIDTPNTLGKGENTMLCIYTSAGGETEESCDRSFTQSIAYSQDGKTFVKYEHNPILENIVTGNRDPKVFWHDESKHWIMILFMNSRIGYNIFRSNDLRDWRETKIIKMNDSIDCPEMFKLKCGDVDKWIFMGTCGKYYVGDFDGEIFTINGEMKRFAHGSVYSSQVWNNSPDGRHIIIFRLGNLEEGSEDDQQMSIPIELSLEYKNATYNLCCEPIRECRNLMTNVILDIQNEHIVNKVIDIDDMFTFEIYVEFQIGNGVSIFGSSNGLVSFDHTNNTIQCMNEHIIIDKPHDNIIKLLLLYDTNSLEIFCNNATYAGYCIGMQKLHETIQITNVIINKLVIKSIQ